MQHFDVIGQGTIPVILHLPHNARYLPEDFDWGLDPESLEKDIFRLVDHHTLELFQPLIDAGAFALHNNLCRLYCDPERFADREVETMNDLGMGVFYTHSTDGQRFREDYPDPVYQRKIDAFYKPYHQRFTELVEETLSRFGRVFIVDGHSYPKEVLPYEQYPQAPRPEVDIGTFTEPHLHTSSEWIEHSRACFENSGYSVALNSPFKGAILPVPFVGDPRVQTMMLEIRRDVYLSTGSEYGTEISLNLTGLKRFHEALKMWLAWSEIQDLSTSELSSSP